MLRVFDKKNEKWSEDKEFSDKTKKFEEKIRKDEPWASVAKQSIYTWIFTVEGYWGRFQDVLVW